MGNRASCGTVGGGGGSNATFNNILQSMQNNLNGSGNSLGGVFGPGSALNLASMFRNDSSTGLTALRMQDGLTGRNSSVDDFLSLVASGDIPHQDPHMLNVPLQSIMTHQQGRHMQNQNQHPNGLNQLQQHQQKLNVDRSGMQAYAQILAQQQQLIAQAVGSGDNSAAAVAAAALGGRGGAAATVAALGGGVSMVNNSAAILSQLAAASSDRSRGGGMGNGTSAAVSFALAQQQRNGMIANSNDTNANVNAFGNIHNNLSAAASGSLKRKLLDRLSTDDLGALKRQR